jgi:hypothetical protein
MRLYISSERVYSVPIRVLQSVFILPAVTAPIRVLQSVETLQSATPLTRQTPATPLTCGETNSARFARTIRLYISSESTVYPYVCCSLWTPCYVL